MDAPAEPRADAPGLDYDTFAHNLTSKPVKDAWIQGEMKDREAQFTDYHDIRVFTGTWNVNGRLPTQPLDPWLQAVLEDAPPAGESTAPPGTPTEPELLILGFQELDLRAEAYLVYDGSKEMAWCKAIEEALGVKAALYRKATSKQLIGMLIVVYVRRDVAEHVRDLVVDSAGCGIMGMIGNKGAVAVRFDYRDSPICVVNCHLAANMNQVERRNQDFHEICRRLTFTARADAVNMESTNEPLPPVLPPVLPAGLSPLEIPGGSEAVADSAVPDSTIPTGLPEIDPDTSAVDPAVPVTATTPAVATATVASAAPPNPTSTAALTVADLARRRATSVTLGAQPHALFDHDYVIWMGDLNYRIPLSGAKILTLLEGKEYKYLQDFDQLNIQKMNRKAFTGFRERGIRFPPTYRFEIGSHHRYDPKRVPAWCDRVLWWSPYGTDYVTQLTYQSHPALLISDHKPVSSLFRIRTRAIRRAEQAVIHSQLLRELDKFENECKPTAKLSDTQLDFGPVEYEKSITRTVTLQNTGRVPVQFRFIPKLDDTEFCRPWLAVNPATGTVLPGCQITIYFTIVVTNASAPTLNTSQEELRDILILHLENGKDYFISVQGNYLPTCFGTGLDVLARLPKPIRHMTLEEIQALGEESQFSVPKEIWRLIDFIYSYGLGVPNLFFIEGKQSLINDIRNCLDTGADWDLATLLPMTEGGESTKVPGRRSSLEMAVMGVGASAGDAGVAVAAIPPSNDGQDEYGSVSDVAKESPEAAAVSTLTLTNDPDTSRRYPDDDDDDDDDEDDEDEDEVEDRYIGVYSVADALIRLLKYLPEPVVPFDYFDRCVEAGYRITAESERRGSISSSAHGQPLGLTGGDTADFGGGAAMGASVATTGLAVVSPGLGRASVGSSSGGGGGGSLATTSTTTLGNDTIENTAVFQVIDSLPRANLNVFVFVITFMKEVALAAPDCDIAKEKLSLLLATTLLRPKKPTFETEDFTGTVMQHRRAFIRQFL